MDATGSVRSYLKSENIHDYELQQQGTESKAMIPAVIHTGYKTIKSQASLYRPSTKKGDPRIWFYGLTKVADPNDIIAITHFEGKFQLFNLTKLDIKELINSSILNPFQELINAINTTENKVAFELLAMLRKIANAGPIPSMVDADTSVGRTLETALGIDINSSKQPDYKGIELKSFRNSRTNRKNLFAQVPDWKLSKFKSSAEILNNFGYEREEDFKLYCTVSAITRNSQGLNLRIDSDIKQLIENSDKPEVGDFVVWTLEKLHNRLKTKHKETFWVEAESTRINDREHFQYKLVEHTKKPITSQFDLLVEQGIITLDHLIKRNSKGKVVEKGPLFKIKPKGIELLFPPSESYNLMA
ncbi:MvaI/BcnI restriction endonuclease family protein [Flavobacteriaceae bacterium]|nr:MvaI/BcnI restriction endonuclease family protein [Flavobacteriaceae bacterium]MDC1522536.1 MvaI/BcnI restriction endonuclease family protein [Flavobacteriaceae bacterium]